jgi:hypothetical protein
MEEIIDCAPSMLEFIGKAGQSYFQWHMEPLLLRNSQRGWLIVLGTTAILGHNRRSAR